MRRTRVFGAFALIASATLVVSACGGSSSGNGPTGSVSTWAAGLGQSNGAYSAPKVTQYTDMVNLITDKAWNDYNNATADAVSTYNGFENVITLLTPYMMDGNNNVVLNKDLMTSVTQTKDSNPQTVVWTINPKAVWSDGAPVSCSDFYLYWLANNGEGNTGPFNSGGTTGYSQMNAPVCSDNGKTVTTTFTSPFVDYKSLFDMTTNALMPAHVLEQATGIADITKLTPNSPASALAPAANFYANSWKGFNPKYDLSDGPYLISAFTPNQSITLTRNPKWWGNPGGPAGFNIKFASDVVTQSKSLQNNEVAVQYSAQPSADGSDALKALSNQGVTYVATPGLSFEHLDLQLKNPLFQDVAVRKAFFQCVDRNQITTKLLGDVEPGAKPANSVMPTDVASGKQDYYSSESTGNAATAKQTLVADGWTPNAQGIMTKNGKTLSFSISHTDIPRRTSTVQLIQSECKAAGMDISDHTDPNFLNGPVAAGQYDVALFAWSSLPFNSAQVTVYQTGGGENWQGLSDPTVDNALKQALAQPTADAALPYYQQADQAIAKTYATLPLFNTPDQWAFSSNWKGIYYQSYNGVLWDANEWQKTGS
ncbi:MAG TPA: ABC transporter family substrate-binding protein [Pseudonocardiaceae bacterium]|jgi:peptide/nickel transport system substrate-binding protein|nr:ABC transporter family substrate-binding protein [Pseudonocardiaceae bacterium]